MFQSIRGPTGAVIFVNLLLAVVAFLKDTLYAIYFGTQQEADQLALSFFIADTLGNGLFAAVLASACVPKLTELTLSGDEARLRSSIRWAVIGTAAIGLLLASLCAIFSVPLLGSFGAELAPRGQDTSTALLLLMLPITLLAPLGAVGTSVLQAQREFIRPAVAPVLLNGVLLAAIVVALALQLPHESGVYVYAMCVTGAAAVMAVYVWQPIVGTRGGVRLTDRLLPRLDPVVRADVREMAAAALPYFFILLTSQTVLLVERYLASQLEVGTIAGLNYAYRISQFPIWVFAAAISAVVLPSLSEWIRSREWHKLQQRLHRSVLAITALTLPLSLLFYVFHEPIVALLFLRGSFDHSSLALTSGMLQSYALCMVGQGISTVVLRYFLAAGQMSRALLVFILSGAVTIALDLVLVARLGAPGIGYAAACGWSLNAVCLWLMMVRSLRMTMKKEGFADGQITSHHSSL
ncbi:murein biosynthesis integral membrane protein MurJ [Paenibacillus sp. YYML68]|uniref:murein biosynthesis integral membrane protein MurJ n=1 Tax=Paenibacillus sp. YYML68 TaxID=2909250 RepID=UPI00249340DE|nr:lipid II flippase MurJ [Paenibacillus sp. YYML68]